MTKVLLLFPNCIFYDNEILNAKYNTIFLVEEPMFFGHDTSRDYNINKVKLAYMRACMKCYYDWLMKHKQSVQYIDYTDVKTYDFVKEYENISIYDPNDYELETRLKKQIEYTRIDSKLFLLSSEDVKGYFEPKRSAKRISQSAFYVWMKAKLRLTALQEVPNLDKENRLALPNTVPLPKIQLCTAKDTKEYYKEAIEWVDNHEIFKNNIGSTEKLHLYPINPTSAKKQFRDFIKKTYCEVWRLRRCFS